MNWLKSKVRAWLDIELGERSLVEIFPQLDELNNKALELKERIQDLEDAYPGYKQAKEDADKTPEPLIAGFMPFSQRKKQFERSHRKPEKK